MTSAVAPATVELSLESAAGDGASVGRAADGLVVFANGGLPGEDVIVEIDSQKKRFAKGRVVEVLTPAPGRREPDCRTARDGCGGCDFAHASSELQHEMKRTVVFDALTRIGRLTDLPPIRLTPTPGARYRTTVRVVIAGGRAGYRRRASHDIAIADECLVAHPLAEDLVVNGRFGNASEVTIRVSASSGERLAIVDGPHDTVDLPADVQVTTSVRRPGESVPFITEQAGGRSWRLSAGSFFQAGPAAATALVKAVGEAVGPVDGRRVVDAYAGIGLFAGTVGASADHVTAIERSSTSAGDCRVNVGENVSVHRSAVESWSPVDADVVIADPSRVGLKQRGVDVLSATNAEQFVLVSCDSGAMGRDARLLVEAGFRLDRIEVVDAFPDTSHIETVTSFHR